MKSTAQHHLQAHRTCLQARIMFLQAHTTSPAKILMLLQADISTVPASTRHVPASRPAHLRLAELLGAPAEGGCERGGGHGATARGSLHGTEQLQQHSQQGGTWRVGCCSCTCRACMGAHWAAASHSVTLTNSHSCVSCHPTHLHIQQQLQPCRAWPHLLQRQWRAALGLAL